VPGSLGHLPPLGLGAVAVTGFVPLGEEGPKWEELTSGSAS